MTELEQRPSDELPDHIHRLAWANSEVHFPRTIESYAFRHTIDKSWRTKIKLATSGDGKRVALKCVAHADTTQEKEYPELMQAPHERLQNETTSLKALTPFACPHIIKFIDFFPHTDYPKFPSHPPMLATINSGESAHSPKAAETPAQSGNKSVAMLVLEYAPHRDMLQTLSLCQKFPEDVARTYFVQLVKALACVHACGLCHCDIRPESILFNEKYTLKLSGFGSSGPADVFRIKAEGAVTNMSPEAACATKADPFNGLKADIWSAGITLLTMLLGHPLFKQPDTTDCWFRQMTRVDADSFWSQVKSWSGFDITPSLKELLTAVLNLDPQARPAAEDILEFAWCKQGSLSQTELADAMKQLVSSNDEGSLCHHDDQTDDECGDHDPHARNTEDEVALEQCLDEEDCDCEPPQTSGVDEPRPS